MLYLGGFSLAYPPDTQDQTLPVMKASNKSVSLFVANAYVGTLATVSSTQQADLSASVLSSEYVVVKSGRVRVDMRASVIGSQKMAVDWRSQERLTASGLWVYKKPLWSFR